jgi:hypothetical protein
LKREMSIDFFSYLFRLLNWFWMSAVTKIQ